MNIRVYQAIEPDFRAASVFDPKKFKYVATVTPNVGTVNAALNKAFDLTNSYDEFWGYNKDVLPAGAAANGCRSTSVGDVIVVDDDFYTVAGFGFEKVDIVTR